MRLNHWTVDYGDGPREVQIPHAWRQDVPVSWEGPAIYRTTLPPTRSGQFLLFEGVSYEAVVRFKGDEIGRHKGIWDAFAVPLPDTEGGTLEVAVTKNGGPTFPVRDVASGFLPFVYHAFGGIYKPVSILDAPPLLSRPAHAPRVVSRGTKLLAQPLKQERAAKDLAAEWLAKRQGTATSGSQDVSGERPLYLRGVLSWGWYPEIGHCNPPESLIRAEVERIRNLGFNLVKFCLWLPPHRYLEVLAEHGMWAWLELPLWDPTPDQALQDAMFAELERVVSQYAHHPNVAVWTCGCELHESTSAAYRQRLYEFVRQATGGALTKDNSGSAEMYGGDLREYGDFYDFHPYCDVPFYPEVLDSLLVGPRPPMPILLGEFNDMDVHRDLSRLASEAPYWSSEDEALNAQGVRWQHDLPGFLHKNRFTRNPVEHRHEALMASSLSKARFVRKTVQEAVRARSEIAGYVVTGLRDTPISTSGIMDDWDRPRFTGEDLADWNGERCLFLIPSRRPPWVHGGNRPGWMDPFNHELGRVFWRVGIHSESPFEGEAEWDVLHVAWDGGARPQGRVAHGRIGPCRADPCTSTELGQIAWEAEFAGGYLLRVRTERAENRWPFWVVEPWSDADARSWTPVGNSERLAGLTGHEGQPMLSTVPLPTGQRGLWLMEGEATLPMPFWRECAFEFHEAPFWDRCGFRERWERLLPISADRAIDMDGLKAQYPSYSWTSLLHRIDVRTYREHPLLVRGEGEGAVIFATTLRPDGGLGSCPRGVMRNPSGMAFLRAIRSWL